MMRHSTDTPKLDVLEDDASLSPAERLPSPAAPSTPAIPPPPNQQEEETKSRLFAQTRAVWDFPKMVASFSAAARDYFTIYFNKDTKFTLRTVRAFEKLAELVPAEQRDDTLKDLGLLLCSRYKGRRGKGQGIGATDELKDANLRFDVKMLIKRLDSSFKDSEAEEEEEEIADNTSIANQMLSNTNRTSRSRGPSVTDHKHSNEDPYPVITAISNNWLSWPIKDYLPDHAYPFGRHESDWPLDLLQAVLELSNTTAGQDEEVQHKLRDVFQSTKKFSHKKSLEKIEAVRRSFLRNDEPAQPESSGEGSNSDEVDGRTTKQTPAPQPSQAAKSTLSSAAAKIRATTTEPPPTTPLTRKRPINRDDASEPPQKRTKHKVADEAKGEGERKAEAEDEAEGEGESGGVSASPTPTESAPTDSEPSPPRRYSSGQVNMQIIIAEFEKIHGRLDELAELVRVRDNDALSSRS
ncbi:hypothetical protein EKO04_004253 [Ascochyta lentis]|uniref:Uncharacterized protein n=1 Tax=Ascochyta lentis TaxID=205686 RepID=A0A8H7J8W1_9PLEO|nr:hypothetical protein EKO04_004253 [Ascochyta lentis]